MTISEKAKFAAVKRHIKAAYNECVGKSERETNKGEAHGYHCAALAYFDCYKQLFFNDDSITEDMLKHLITDRK